VFFYISNFFTIIIKKISLFCIPIKKMDSKQEQTVLPNWGEVRLGGLGAISEDNGKILPESARQGGADNGAASADRQAGGHKSDKKSKKWLWIGIMLIVLIVIIVLIYWYVRRCRQRNQCHTGGPSCPIGGGGNYHHHPPPPPPPCDDDNDH
jgi:hypothetical protein